MDNSTTLLNFLIPGLSAFCLGTVELCVNVMVFLVLPKSGLTYATELLMKTQCMANSMVLITLSYYAPFITIFPDLFDQTNFAHRIPGAVALTGTYLGFYLQALMAVNRLFSLGFRNLAGRIFAKRNTRIFYGTGMVISVGYGTLALFSCCTFHVFPNSLEYGYTGTMASAQVKVGMSYLAFLFLTCVSTYVVTLARMRKFRNAISNHEISAQEAKKELRVFFSFLTTATFWATGTGTFLLLIVIPPLRDTWVLWFQFWHRYIMQVVDPVVYTLLIKKCRNELAKKMLQCNHGGAVVPASQSGFAQNTAVGRSLRHGKSNNLRVTHQNQLVGSNH